jgi:hypothetical protein
MMVIAAPFCSQSQKGSPTIRHRRTLDSPSKYKVSKIDHSCALVLRDYLSALRANISETLPVVVIDEQGDRAGKSVEVGKPEVK